MSTSVILGPPGTGKTTALLDIVGQERKQGTPTDRIAFVSFTKRAATEATERAQIQFQLAEHELPYFRTLHSLAYSRLGTRREQLIQMHHYKELGRALGLKISGKIDTDDDTLSQVALGDKLLFIENLSRVRKVSLQEQFRLVDDDEVTWSELDRFARGLAQYKHETGLVDFTDLITRFNMMRPCPQLGALIVDEAQDLSAIQWEMVGHLARASRRVYIAGDDDQAIYRWAGADVGHFITLASDQTRVLDKSYRLRENIYNVAVHLAGRIKQRRPKTWEPRAPGGTVLHHTHLESVDLRAGDWLLLARQNQQVKEMARYCLDSGLPFSMGGKSPLTEGYVKHVTNWEVLCKGGSITGAEAKDLYSLMVAGQGYQDRAGLFPQLGQVKRIGLNDLRENYGLTARGSWTEVLTKLPSHLKRYYQLVTKRGESLTAPPRIRLSTIHGVKGGEADHVAVVTDLSTKTYDGFINQPDDEHRVFYVAVSRAKESLHLVEASSRFAYPIR